MTASGFDADRGASQREPRLDGVRGLAIGLVLVGHATAWSPGAAVAGVDLFFVLSGFLITRMLLREWTASGAIGLAKFWLRRALRLAPALLVFLVAYTIWALVARGPMESLRIASVLGGLAYASNWVAALGHPHAWELGHLWSLATEEQFYVLWPLVLMLVLKKGRRGLVRGVVLAIGCTAVLRAILLAIPNPLRAHLYYNPVTWADSLLIGCLLGAWQEERTLPDVPWWQLSAALCVLGFVLAAPQPELMYAGGISLLAAAMSVIVRQASRPPSGRFDLLGHPILTWLGRVSYGTYLWHVLILYWIQNAGIGISDVVAGAASIALALLLASASHRFVESPFLRLKARFEWRRSDRADATRRVIVLEPAGTHPPSLVSR